MPAMNMRAHIRHLHQEVHDLELAMEWVDAQQGPVTIRNLIDHHLSLQRDRLAREARVCEMELRDSHPRSA